VNSSFINCDRPYAEAAAKKGAEKTQRSPTS